MKDTMLLPVALALGIYSVSLVGCGKPEPTSSNESSESSAPAFDDHGGHDHDGHDHGDHGAGAGMSDMEKMRSELAKLSPEKAAAAEKQHICPVSGKMLGAMGAPIQVDAEGQSVWICCEGCRKRLLKDPQKYLAKIKR